MKKTSILGAFCAIAFFSLVFSTRRGSSASQEATTGEGLLGSCQISVRDMDDRNHKENAFEAYREGYCDGLVYGISNASPRVCPDKEVTNGQSVRVVLKYLQDHPEELHLDNAVLVERALALAFPCGDKR